MNDNEFEMARSYVSNTEEKQEYNLRKEMIEREISMFDSILIWKRLEVGEYCNSIRILIRKDIDVKRAGQAAKKKNKRREKRAVEKDKSAVEKIRELLKKIVVLLLESLR